jgi:hypothetical protein
VIYDDVAKQIRVEPIPEQASMGLALVACVVVGAVFARQARRTAGQGG